MIFWLIWALIKVTAIVLYVCGMILLFALRLMWIGLLTIAAFVVTLLTRKGVATQ